MDYGTKLPVNRPDAEAEARQYQKQDKRKPMEDYDREEGKRQ
jgi:hypothetical protein